MNKKIATEFAIGVILIIAIIIGFSVWTGNKPKQAPVAKVNSTNNNLIVSDYGLSYSVPSGWHIWEGVSASLELANKTDFQSVTESALENPKALTSAKADEYQAFMDNWKAESSEVVVLADSKTLDYKNRDLADAGKIMSRIVDSEDFLKQREITMFISTGEVNLNDESVNDETLESRNIKINGKDARLSISKKMKLVDWIIIRIPIDSNKEISGKKVSMIAFWEYVKKNNPNGLDELISFINSLNIANNQ